MKRHFLLVLLFFLASCSKQLKKREVLELQTSVARFSQIPDAPVYATVKKVVRSEKNPDDAQVFYNCQGLTGLQDIKLFYIEEMERSGWQLDLEYEGHEVLLEFSKPSGMVCHISIRSKNNYVVTLIQKKEMA